MTKKEKREAAKEQLYIYSGILFHNRKFAEGKEEAISYDFSCPEFAQLREKYDLETIAGKGSDFVKAKRLLHYLAPRLTHSSWYDNHVPCNALDLLEYSLNNPEQGINCLNKSKILEECCLALGIYARRVSIMPYSPYDFDNHVVTEIFDRKMGKWIMLDPTTDAFFVDENKTPLSLLEMRERFANDEFITFVVSTDSLKDLNKLREKYMEINAYICKNLFYFVIDQECGFGPPKHRLTFCPENYGIKEKEIANSKFRIRNMPEEYADRKEELQKKVKILMDSEEREVHSISAMERAPVES